MAVRETKRTFKTDDGAEFDTKEQAESHDELTKAHQAYNSARQNLGYLLAQRQKTGDGLPFDFHSYGDYFFVRERWGELPRLGRVAFYIHNTEFRFSDGEDLDVMEILYTDKVDEKPVAYRIADLYHSREKAEDALRAAMNKHLESVQLEIKKLRKPEGK